VYEYRRMEETSERYILHSRLNVTRQAEQHPYPHKVLPVVLLLHPYVDHARDSRSIQPKNGGWLCLAGCR
jgi:hypothetical protein